MTYLTYMDERYFLVVYPLNGDNPPYVLWEYGTALSCPQCFQFSCPSTVRFWPGPTPSTGCAGCSADLSSAVMRPIAGQLNERRRRRDLLASAALIFVFRRFAGFIPEKRFLKSRRVSAAHDGNKLNPSFPATCASERTLIMPAAAEQLSCKPLVDKARRALSTAYKTLTIML